MAKKTIPRGESKIVNVRMHPAFVSEIDLLVEHRGYMSRSDFILSAVRYYIDHVAYRDDFLNRMQERGMIRKFPPPPVED